MNGNGNEVIEVGMGDRRLIDGGRLMVLSSSLSCR